MMQAEYIASLDRLAFDNKQFARELQSLGDERSLSTIIREAQRLRANKYTTRELPMPWAVAALVRVLEREREQAQAFTAEIDALRHDMEAIYQALIERLNERRNAA